MPPLAPGELDKLALRIVATDRQLAAALVPAVRRWAATQKATTRVVRATMLAEAIAGALHRTTV